MINIRPQDITPVGELPVSAIRAADTHLAAATHPSILTDGPILTDDRVAAALSSRGLADVLAVRIQQIEEFGHSPAADDAVTLWNWGVMFGQGAGHLAADIRNGLPTAKWRKKLVKLAAFILAMIDRIDREPQQGEPFV